MQGEKWLVMSSRFKFSVQYNIRDSEPENLKTNKNLPAQALP